MSKQHIVLTTFAAQVTISRRATFIMNTSESSVQDRLRNDRIFSFHKYSRSISSGVNSLSGSYKSNLSDIFYIDTPTSFDSDESKQKKEMAKLAPVDLVHHSNLEVDKLTAEQHVKLSMLYYLKWQNMARIVFIVTCLAWFLFNTYTIWDQYAQYETIVFMDYQRPTTTLPPAISVCLVCTSCL